MAASTTDTGNLAYWFDGLPYAGLNKGAGASGGFKYWFDGLPFVDSLTTGSQDLSLPTISSGTTLAAPTVIAEQAVTTGTIASGSALSAPTVEPGAVDLTLPTISSGSSLAAPSLSVGAVDVTPPTISDTTLAAPTVEPGAVDLTLPTIADTTLADPTVEAITEVALDDTIASGSTLAAPSVAAGISLPTISSGTTLAGPTDVDVITPGMVTQAVVETFGEKTALASVTQSDVEVFGGKTSAISLTQSDAEVFGAKVADADITQVVIEVFGLPLLVPPAVECLDTPALIGYPYYAIFIVTGGRAPFTYSISAGSLPDGITLNTSNGLVSGTPTTAGTYAYTIRVDDDAGQFGEASCGFVVEELPPPPLEYEPPCEIITPEVWVCLQDAAGAVRANVAMRAAMRDAADFLGGYKAPRLQSVGVVNRSASDWLNRNWSAQTCDITIADSDRTIASLTSLSSVERSQFYLYLTSDTNRRLETLPRLLFQGPIYSDETTDLQRHVTSNDIIGINYELFGGGIQLPKRTITGADFPTTPNTGAIPIIGGHVTDEINTFNGGADNGNPEFGHGPIRLQYGALKGIDVGNLTVNGITRRAVLFAGHALKNYDHLFLLNPQAFGPVLYQDGILTNNGIAEARYGVDFWVPGKAGWTTFVPSGVPYVDINGHRYSVVFVADAIAATYLDNGWELRANVQGAEDVGDGSGDLIQDAGELCEWMFLNWLIGDYQSGAWLTSPQFEFYPGSGILIDRINHGGFMKASAIGTTLVPGGLLGSLVVGANGQQESSSEVIANMLRSWNMLLRWNQYNQLEVVMLDRRRDVFLGTERGVTWKADILTQPRFKAVAKDEWFANVVQGYWGFYWAGIPFFKIPDDTVTSGYWGVSGTSLATYGRVDKKLVLPYVLDKATALAVIQEYTDFSSVPRWVATWAQSLCALRTDILDGTLVTHYAGPTPEGWTRQAVWILNQRINAGAATVEIDAVNIDDLLT